MCGLPDSHGEDRLWSPFTRKFAPGTLGQKPVQLFRLHTRQLSSAWLQLCCSIVPSLLCATLSTSAPCEPEPHEAEEASWSLGLGQSQRHRVTPCMAAPPTDGTQVWLNKGLSVQVEGVPLPWRGEAERWQGAHSRQELESWGPECSPLP